MSTTELENLLATVEALRQSLHPTLDPALLRAVVEVEEANPEDNDAAMKEINRVLRGFLPGEGR